MKRRVFYVSDRTGITAESLGETLLTQFPAGEFSRTTLPFVDDPAKARAVAHRLREVAVSDGVEPIVFSTLTDPDVQAAIAASTPHLFDLFDTFIGPLEAALGLRSSRSAGRLRGMVDAGRYQGRMDALNYTLDHDDGVRLRDLERADLILLGVSRCGKTLTCLYLALQFHLHAANYPLTEEDLTYARLPDALAKQREKLQGLTIQPERLSRVREERRPGSRYASIQRCRTEVQQAESMFRAEGIPCLDTTTISIEEIATLIVDQRKLRHRES